MWDEIYNLISEASGRALLEKILPSDLIAAHTENGQFEISREEFSEWHIEELINSRFVHEKIQRWIKENKLNFL